MKDDSWNEESDGTASTYEEAAKYCKNKGGIFGNHYIPGRE